MYELKPEEIDEVNGGFAAVVGVVVAITVSFAIGVYNGYQEEAAADKGKKSK